MWIKVNDSQLIVVAGGEQTTLYLFDITSSEITELSNYSKTIDLYSAEIIATGQAQFKFNPLLL